MYVWKRSWISFFVLRGVWTGLLRRVFNGISSITCSNTLKLLVGSEPLIYYYTQMESFFSDDILWYSAYLLMPDSKKYYYIILLFVATDANLLAMLVFCFDSHLVQVPGLHMKPTYEFFFVSFNYLILEMSIL